MQSKRNDIIDLASQRDATKMKGKKKCLILIPMLLLIYKLS